MQHLILSITLLFMSNILVAAEPKIIVSEPKGGETFLQGQAFSVAFETANAPEESSVGFYLVKNLPEQELANAPGPDGAIMAKGIDVPSYGKGSFYWDAKSFACVERGHTAVCGGAVLEPGPYRIEAVLYDQTIAPLAKIVYPPGTAAPKRLASNYSKEFIIKPASETIVLEKRLFEAAVYKLAKTMELDLVGETKISKYVVPQGPIKGPDKDGLFCQKYYAARPFNGNLLACGKNEEGSEIKLGAKLDMVGGIIPYKEAKKIAEKLTQEEYGTRVDFVNKPVDDGKNKDIVKNATYLETGVIKWSYLDVESYWIFIVKAIKAGGNPKGSDRFQDSSVVRINNDGRPCFVANMSYKEGLVASSDRSVNHCR